MSVLCPKFKHAVTSQSAIDSLLASDREELKEAAFIMMNPVLYGQNLHWFIESLRSDSSARVQRRCFKIINNGVGDFREAMWNAAIQDAVMEMLRVT